MMDLSSSRKNYFKNYRYEEIPVNSKKGFKHVYKYVGNYYTWDFPDRKLRFYKRFFFLFEVFSLVLFFVTGIQRTPLNSHTVVVIPAVLCICAWIFEIVAACFFLFMKFPLKEEDFKRINSTFQITFVFRFLCLAASGIACMVFLFTSNAGLSDILVTFAYFASAGCALVLNFNYRNISSKKKTLPGQN